MFDALAKRTLMNHFLILEIKQKILKGTTYRVCPDTTLGSSKNPRWKADKPIWKKIEKPGLGVEVDEDKVLFYNKKFLEEGEFLPYGDTFK